MLRLLPIEPLLPASRALLCVFEFVLNDRYLGAGLIALSEAMKADLLAVKEIVGNKSKLFLI